MQSKVGKAGHTEWSLGFHEKLIVYLISNTLGSSYPRVYGSSVMSMNLRSILKPAKQTFFPFSSSLRKAGCLSFLPPLLTEGRQEGPSRQFLCHEPSLLPRASSETKTKTEKACHPSLLQINHRLLDATTLRTFSRSDREPGEQTRPSQACHSPPTKTRNAGGNATETETER